MSIPGEYHAMDYGTTEEEAKGKPWVNIIPRSEWGAFPPREDIPIEPLPTPIKHIGYSCSTGIACFDDGICRTRDECLPLIRDIQKRDMEERGLADIAYNFIIGDDGYVYEGRGWDKRPEIWKEDPEKYDSLIDVGYMGINNGEMEYLHWDMYESLIALINRGRSEGKIVDKYLTKDLCDPESADWTEDADLEEPPRFRRRDPSVVFEEMPEGHVREDFQP